MNNDINSKNFTGKFLYFSSAPRPQNRITESRENLIFSKTLPASKRDEAKSLKELLEKQQAGIAKASSQPTLSEMIEQSKLNSLARARDKLIIDLEMLLQKQQIILQIDRLEHSTPKAMLTFEEFQAILKSYGVLEILKPCITQIKSALKTSEGFIDFKNFISCLKKAQAVPRFVLPKPRVLTPLSPIPWKLPPLPPIYGKQTAKVDRWSEKEWEDYYFNEHDHLDDDNDDDEKEEQKK